MSENKLTLKVQLRTIKGVNCKEREERFCAL